MSQVTEKKDAIAIERLSLEQCKSALDSFSQLKSCEPVRNFLPQLTKCVAPKVVAEVNSVKKNISGIGEHQTIESPNTLYKKFKHTYQPMVKEFKQQGLTTVEAKKASALAVLSELDYRMSESTAAIKHLEAAVAEEDEAQVNKALKSCFHELEVTHTRVFTSMLADVCAKASIASGFREITVKPLKRSSGVVVSAINETGQGLVSEINVDKKQQVNTKTEVIGIHDGSCAEVMNRFNEALRRLGVKYSSETTRSTRVSHDDAIEQNKRLERTRALNQRRQRHH